MFGKPKVPGQEGERCALVHHPNTGWNGWRFDSWSEDPSRNAQEAAREFAEHVLHADPEGEDCYEEITVVLGARASTKGLISPGEVFELSVGIEYEPVFRAGKPESKVLSEDESDELARELSDLKEYFEPGYFEVDPTEDES